MANVEKTFLDWSGLQTYNTKIKNYIDTADLLSIKYAAVSSDGNNLLLYKIMNPTSSDQPAYTIPMGSTALKNFVKSLGTAVGATLNAAETEYSVTFTGDIASATDIVTATQSLDTHIGTLASLSTTEKTNIVGAINEVLGAITTAIQGLDVSEFALASVSNNVVTIKGIKEVDGKIAVGDGAGISLEEVAYTGAAEDVSYDNTDSGLDATDVQAAIDEVAAESASGAASKTVYITETSGSSSDAFSKRYGIYQGSAGSSASPVVGEKLADIDIPKDMVVESGSVVDVVFVSADNSLHEGSASGTDVTAEIKGTGTATAADAGKYIKLTIANATSSHLWIKATDLVDIYTAQPNAAQVQLAIDSNNVISATIVAGSIGTTELADDSVTASKVSIAAHSESQTHTGGTTDDGLSITVTTTDGQVSAVSGSIAANTYDAYGAATAAVAALDVSNLSIASNDGTTGAVTIVGSISQTDGAIGAGSADSIVFTPITSTQINSLFS